VTFDAEGTPQIFSAIADVNGVLDARLTAVGVGEGDHRVVVSQNIFGVSVAPAEAIFRVPCVPPLPLLTSDITCGPAAAGAPAAYILNVTGTGFLPGRVDLTFDANGILPEPTTATADAYGNFGQPIFPTGRGPGTYVVLAHQQVAATGTIVEASFNFLVECDGPQFRLTPDSGPPGFVLTVIGQGFPPSTMLDLLWSRGIGAARPITVFTDTSGNFTRQVLIFHGDFQGTRMLSVEEPSDPLALAGLAPLPFRVTEQTISPPFSLPDAPPGSTIIFRR
jgi:hypothetical protein